MMHAETCCSCALHVRPVVRWFAELIEAALVRNDHKRDWNALHPDELNRLFNAELVELAEAEVIADPASVIHETVDVAAVLMFLADRYRETPSKDRGRA